MQEPDTIRYYIIIFIIKLANLTHEREREGTKLGRTFTYDIPYSEKFWRNWRFSFEIVKLTPRHIKFFLSSPIVIK